MSDRICVLSPISANATTPVDTRNDCMLGFLPAIDPQPRGFPADQAFAAGPSRSGSLARGGDRAAAFDMAERDPSLGQIVGRKLERNLVARNDTDVVLAHLARAVRDELVAVVERDAIAGIGQHFSHDAI